MASPACPDELYIIGAGGMGREAAWLARRTRPSVKVTLVVQPGHLPPDDPGLLVIEASPSDLDSEVCRVVAVGEPAVRRRLSIEYDVSQANSPCLFDPTAVIGPSVELMPGALVCAGVILTSEVTIGRHAIVNVGSTLSHDVHVGDFVTISPGVHVAGHVEIGDEAFLGVGCTVINGSSGRPLVIGRRAVVAAGAVVTEAVPAGVLVAGVPARLKRRLS